MKKGPLNFVYATRPQPPTKRREADFDQFEAMELYCAKCRRAVPVRKSLLLVLPEGDKYEYCCPFCGSTVGDKIERGGGIHGVL
jgi:hypothetical protein